MIDTDKSSIWFVEALVERWWDTMYIFYLPCGELGFTPLDWIMLTGLSIGVGDPPPYNDEYTLKVAKALFFSDISDFDWKSKRIRWSFLKYFFANQLEAVLVDDIITERIVRAFFLFFLGEFLFPNNVSVVIFGWLAVFDDLDRVTTSDWGSLSVALMYVSYCL